MPSEPTPIQLPQPEEPETVDGLVAPLNHGLDEAQVKSLAALLNSDELAFALDPFMRAAVILAAEMDVLGLGNNSPRARRTRARLGAAAAMMALSSRSRTPGIPITEEEKNVFLVALASGIGATKAASLVPSVNPSSWYYLRRHDHEFAEAWDDALEMRVEPVLERMSDIALFGDERLMTTVKAAELVVRDQSRRSRGDIRSNGPMPPGGRKVTITFESNVTLPD